MDVASNGTRRTFFLLLILLAGSGCAALIYEVVWFQLLQLVIGSSAVSLGLLLLALPDIARWVQTTPKGILGTLGSQQLLIALSVIAALIAALPWTKRLSASMKFNNVSIGPITCRCSAFQPTQRPLEPQSGRRPDQLPKSH